jgi:hypothetical protein
VVLLGKSILENGKQAHPTLPSGMTTEVIPFVEYGLRTPPIFSHLLRSELGTPERWKASRSNV